ncbi:H-type lectin domain-containing protein [Celeribacter halophilus]|uniref:H-type lectin domain-containing protein n=1 Tax=Celeribacter halophilus TaxID=576117 RepID=UPI002FD5908D
MTVMPDTKRKSMPTPVTFPQTVHTIGDVQIICSSDELFNHVDDNLPMWSGEGDRLVSANITFTKPFKEPPAVTLGVSGIDAERDHNLRFWIHARNVTEKGFTIEFSTWYDTHIARAGVSWQAFGPANSK